MSGCEVKSTLRTWIVPIGIALVFLLWGLLIFVTVGDKGPPKWHFGVVEDIPGQSPYATEFTEPRPQHVSE